MSACMVTRPEGKLNWPASIGGCHSFIEQQAAISDDGRRDNQAILRIRVSQHEEQVQSHSSIANEKCRARVYEVHDTAKLASELR